MKKIIFTIVTICLTVIGIKAQPVITYAGNAPQIGDSYRFSVDSATIDPGSAGANQSWDFSTITPTSFYSVAVVSPGSTPFASDFPESNTAFQYTSDREWYGYIDVKTSEMLNDGVGFDPGSDNEYFIHYTDAAKLIKYPFSYNDSYTDSYYTSYTMPEGMDIHEHSNVTVTADAWGSVSTPAAVYNNTLRVKLEFSGTDSVFVMGTFMYVTTHSLTQYEWYTATSHSVIISICVSTDGSSISYRSDSDGIDEQASSQQLIHLYPNPATDKIDIELPKELDHSTEVNIYNSKGKQVTQFTMTKGSSTADISSLSPGMYVVTVGNSYTGKFIKQ